LHVCEDESQYEVVWQGPVEIEEELVQEAPSARRVAHVEAAAVPGYEQ
jgi:hypothetical protein